MIVVPRRLMSSSRSTTWRHQRVEVTGRLVREQEAASRRAHGQSRRAATTAGELRGNVLHARCEADDFQRLSDPLALRRVHAAIAQRHVDVVEHVEVGNQVEALEDETDLLVANARALVVRQAADVSAVELVRAGVEGLQQARDVQERRSCPSRKAWSPRRTRLRYLEAGSRAARASM